MGRAPCCAKDAGLNRGAWTAQEDMILAQYITIHGDGGWRSVPLKAGLKRCGKSCRLRWLNYLRPDIKRGNISPDEEDLIIRMHGILGNRWSLIAGRLPGRTDNEIKNYWNTQLIKKLQHDDGSSAPETKKSKCSSRRVKDHHLVKSVPVRTTPVRLAKCSGKPELNSGSDHRNFELKGDSAQIFDASKSWCELWADELMTGSDFELLDITTDKNIIEAKSPSIQVNGYRSPFSVSNFTDEPFPHSQPAAENEFNPFKSSVYSSELSSPASNLFSSLCVSPKDFATEEFEETPSNEMEQMCSLQIDTQNVGSFVSRNEQGIEQILSDISEETDWVDELLRFKMSSPISPRPLHG